MSQLLGAQITYKKTLSSVRVSWKQGSILGIGGDRTENYNVYVYSLAANGSNILVFVHESMSLGQSAVIDKRFQYGCQNGSLFLVLHDKSNTPYQYRFVENQNMAAQWAKFFNEKTKAFTAGFADLSWIAGDYLRDF